MKIFALILKTLGDFFLDAKGDGDPQKFFAMTFCVCTIIAVCTNQPSWVCGGFLGGGLVLFILAIWHDKALAKKPPDPTQGMPRS